MVGFIRYCALFTRYKVIYNRLICSKSSFLCCRSALKWWSDALDCILQLTDSPRTWRQHINNDSHTMTSLKPLLSRCGIWGCMLGGVLATKLARYPFWTPGLPEGVLSNHPWLWSVVRPSVFKYLRDVHCFFLIFCMKLVLHKGTKVTEPDF